MKRRTRPSSSGLLTLFDTAIASLTGNSVNEEARVYSPAALSQHLQFVRLPRRLGDGRFV